MNVTLVLSDTELLFGYLLQLLASSGCLPKVNWNALVEHRTILHDLSVLATRRTMEIDSQPMEIVTYSWKQSGDLRGWWVWLVRIKLRTRVRVWVRFKVRFRVC